MKLGTINIDNPKSYQEKRDGQLIIISKDEKLGAIVPKDITPSLLVALESWDKSFELFKDIETKLNNGNWKEIVQLNQVKFKAPLPRTYHWLDGSAFLSHVKLSRKARGVELPKNLLSDPLMYQGISDYLDGPNEDLICLDESYGLDLEGEVAIVLDEVPLGTKASAAEKHIKLITLLNDVSLRGIIFPELEKGFGFLQGKPSTSFAPFAVTPDELGTAWKGGRIELDLECKLNGVLIGNPSASEMHFSFFELIEHAAKTRRLSPGTIIGSGTVSNQDQSRGVACLVEKRMLEIINAKEQHPDQPELHKPSTSFLKPGDEIEIDMKKDGKSVFGKISQKVIVCRSSRRSAAFQAA